MRNMLGLTLLALLVQSSLVRAEEPTPRLHLALEGALFGHTSARSKFAGIKQRGSSFDLGYPQDFGARAGYRALRSLEVGATFVLGYAAIDQQIDSQGYKLATNTHTIAAYARYSFGSERCRLFVGPRLGGRFSWQRDRDSGDAAMASSGRSRALIAGIELGLYGHVADALSLDPFVAFTYDRHMSIAGRDIPTQFESASFRTSMGIALSGWLFSR